MVDIVAAHEKDLTELVVQGRPGIRFFLRDEHLAGQVRDLSHTALDVLQSLVLCLKLPDDRIARGNVHRRDLLI